MKAKSITGGYNKYLIFSLLKGLHVWTHNFTSPQISRKTNKVHMLVKEARAESNWMGQLTQGQAQPEMGQGPNSLPQTTKTTHRIGHNPRI